MAKACSLEILAFSLSAAMAFAEEWTPAAVWVKGGATPKNGAMMMVDGNRATFAELPDDSLTGKDAKTFPSLGAAPITATFVLDLGVARKICGARLVAQPSRWLARMASDISVFACGDPQGATSVRVLREHAALPFVFCGDSAFVEWPAVETRYLGIVVHDSAETSIIHAGTFLRWLEVPIRAMWGHPASGGGNNFVTDIAEVSVFDKRPEDFPVPVGSGLAYPRSRLEKDWLMQDAGLDRFTEAFTTNAAFDQQIIAKVAAELGVSPPSGEPTKALYLRLCLERRVKRLKTLQTSAPSVVYVKHFLFGGNSPHSGTSYVTDDLTDARPKNWRKGGALCLLTVLPDGTVTNEVLLERPEGCVRDPALSPDGKTLVFSMRDSYNLNKYYVPHRFTTDFDLGLPWDAYLNRHGDDFHLYTMDLATRKVRQITFSHVLSEEEKKNWPGITIFPSSDTEPSFLSDGRIVFESTRCERVVPCHQELFTNTYICDADGSHARRLTFDGASNFFPQELDDGRIVYTRWEYNDRNARFQQSLFTMNPDGTKQEAYYGNNSFYPCAFFHARQIPGTGKLLAINSGHHVNQRGKLVTVDRRKGMEEDSGIEFVAGSSLEETPGVVQSHYAKGPKATVNAVDAFGQFGPQWQYPFPLDEKNWVVAFLPEGALVDKSAESPYFGIYWQNEKGERELLAYDPTENCCQPVVLQARKAIPRRESVICWDRPYGRFHIQNVYVGRGLEGITSGTVKALRVVGLESRPVFLHKQLKNPWMPGDAIFTPYFSHLGDDGRGETVSAIGAWDVKHVLGEVDVAPDGSCSFECPANNAVYFQLLDSLGRCVQTMRSWTMVAPGEEFACVGCHEDKMQVYPADKGLASAKVQRLRPAAGQPPHPLLARLDKEGMLASAANYLGVDAPRSSDPDAPTEGFSFVRRIQPILNAHCVKCHDGTDKCKGRPDLTAAWDSSFKEGAARKFSKAYCSLTSGGAQTARLNWYSNAGRSEMLPPCAQGSTQSKIMEHFEPAHHGVKVSDAGKRLFACWIDLAIPFAGSYAEQTVWTAEDRKIFEYHQHKRELFALQEVNALRSQLKLSTSIP